MNGFTKYWNRPDRAAYLFLTPSFLVLLLFTVIPLLGTFAISFTDLNIFFTSRNFVNFGVTMTILLTAIQGISPSLYESAQMDGATNRQQFFNITLPQIVPSLGFCILTNLIGSMQVFDQVYVATAGGPQFKTETAVQYIYSRGFTAPYELGYASALSSVLFIIVATIAISTNVYMSRKEKQMK